VRSRNLVDIYHWLGDTSSFNFRIEGSQYLKMEAACSFETLIHIYQSIQNRISEDCTLNNHHHENLISYIYDVGFEVLTAVVLKSAIF
jgi:hypothetical protein